MRLPESPGRDPACLTAIFAVKILVCRATNSGRVESEAGNQSSVVSNLPLPTDIRVSDVMMGEWRPCEENETPKQLVPNRRNAECG